MKFAPLQIHVEFDDRRCHQVIHLVEGVHGSHVLVTVPHHKAAPPCKDVAFGWLHLGAQWALGVVRGFLDRILPIRVLICHLRFLHVETAKLLHLPKNGGHDELAVCEEGHKHLKSAMSPLLSRNVFQKQQGVDWFLSSQKRGKWTHTHYAQPELFSRSLPLFHLFLFPLPLPIPQRRKQTRASQSIPVHLTAELSSAASASNPCLILLQPLVKPEQSQTPTISDFLLYFLTGLCHKPFSRFYQGCEKALLVP